ncbi:metal-sulfur cluster assembly factor [Parapedobacter koreensis]|uniref:Metal-sulfur cluster biosynthetic enzyme n=1 Tax=Parapedobacter koreensis TaxID=332977 RepID=A0A1H7RHT3_9SPHI|nr:metal-sulfur cluster assembly factor [Parapedobacter koreensis]SEL59890.1 Metal-sulfur cluster biosynthetic enzyme [Parapedobacter koreensis]
MELSLSSPYVAEYVKAQTALMQVIDPELSVNIIDLGLLYGIDFSDAGKAVVTMTLSTPYCPMGDAIQSGVVNVLKACFPDREVEINLVWEPEWNYDRISESGKAQLGLI